MNDDFLTIPEAAKQIGVCSETVRKWLDLGVLKWQELPPTRHGGRSIIRIPKSAISEFMQDSQR